MKLGSVSVKPSGRPASRYSTKPPSREIGGNLLDLYGCKFEREKAIVSLYGRFGGDQLAHERVTTTSPYL